MQELIGCVPPPFLALSALPDDPSGECAAYAGEPRGNNIEPLGSSSGQSQQTQQAKLCSLDICPSVHPKHNHTKKSTARTPRAPGAFEAAIP